VIDPLQRKGGQFATVGKCDRLTECRVVADLMHCRHRSGQLEIGQIDTRLDDVENQSRRADLEVGGHLGEVRVADDAVQPAVLVGICMRFVASVDDAALERRFEPDLDFDVVGSLGQLEPGLVAGLPDPDAP
jgi:hypothetical protein